MRLRNSTSMLFAAVLVQQLPAASLTLVEEVPNTMSWPKMRVPKWSNGALVVVRDDHSINPSIWVVEHQSTHVVPFTIPGAQTMHIYDWDRGADGTIGVSGSAVDADGRVSGFIAWISSDERTSQVIRTGLYQPWRLAIAPDGTLWAAGREAARLGSDVLKPESGIVRHFERFGKNIGSFVPQSTNRDDLALVDPANSLRATRDRIAWYSPKEGRYVEISFAGKVLTDTSLARPGQPSSHVGGLAITDKGEVFVSAEGSTTVGSSSRFAGIYMLDKSTRAWKTVLERTIKAGAQAETEGLGRILGVDDDRLVLDGPQHLKFYKIGY